MEKQKKEIISLLKINQKDVGSSEVQIGLLSEKIKNLTSHFKKNKNDKHSTTGLVKAVKSKRAAFLITKKIPKKNKILPVKLNI